MKHTTEPKDKSTAAFVMSLVGILLFLPLGILGYIWAKETERHYEAETLPRENQGLTTAAKVLGILCMAGLAVFAVLVVILIASG